VQTVRYYSNSIIQNNQSCEFTFIECSKTAVRYYLSKNVVSVNGLTQKENFINLNGKEYFASFVNWQLYQDLHVQSVS